MYEMEMEKSECSAFATTCLKICSNDRGITPGSLLLPNIVCVLPEPVIPYAKTLSKKGREDEKRRGEEERRRGEEEKKRREGEELESDNIGIFLSFFLHDQVWK